MNNEREIRTIISTNVEQFADRFAERHIKDVDNPLGVINMKKNNILIKALGWDHVVLSALSRSLDSSMGTMIEKHIAFEIAELYYTVKTHVTGPLYPSQINMIAQLLEHYCDKNDDLKPCQSHYTDIQHAKSIDMDIDDTDHISDFYLIDNETNTHHLIELKIGGNLDNKKSRSEKESIFKQFAILSNSMSGDCDIKCHFATAYNTYSDGGSDDWKQLAVKKVFAPDELLIGRDFWNFICHSEDGYDVFLDEYNKSAHFITESYERIKQTYLK